jgi:hypothetical protein
MAISRFQVMAVLQAARANSLGLPLASAYSWGLNRAIFYAAAKRGFRGGGETTARPSGKKGATGETRLEGEAEKKEEEFFLGDEKAYLDLKSSRKDVPLFEIGSEAQTENDFEKQIVSRFGDKTNFREAWSEALKIVRSFDENTLKSQHEFFEQVYKPKRDALSKKWTEEFTATKKRKLPAVEA